ncbi:MAG: DUF2141 domain-containing protein [Bacteroidota bacterium]
MRLFIVILLWAISMVAFYKVSADSGSIAMEVKGDPKEKGDILVALFSSASGFPYEGKNAIRLAKGKCINGSSRIVIDNVSPGTYAISVFQDRNGDQKFNTNFLGIPQEGYGVSNNALHSFRAPEFEESSFKHTSHTELEIHLAY